jgi:hypothetical protein
MLMSSVIATQEQRNNSGLCYLRACRPQLVKGFMQLYSVDQKRSQALEAHAAAFATIGDRTVISFAQKTFANGVLTSKLHVIELGSQPGTKFFLPDVDHPLLM